MIWTAESRHVDIGEIKRKYHAIVEEEEKGARGKKE